MTTNSILFDHISMKHNIKGTQNQIYKEFSQKKKIQPSQCNLKINQDDLAYVYANRIRQIFKGVNINLEEFSIVQHFLQKHFPLPLPQQQKSQLNQKSNQGKSNIKKQLLNPENLIEKQTQSSIQIYQEETSFEQIFQNLVADKYIVNPLDFVINKNIDVNNLEVLFYVLCDQMRQAGRSFFMSLKPDESLMQSFHRLLTANSTDSMKYLLILQETPDLTYEKIASDEDARIEFIKKIKKSLSIDLNVQESQIRILSIEKGSIKVILEIIDSSGQPICELYLQEMKGQFSDSKLQLQYFEKAGLSENDFNPTYNKNWNDYEFGYYCQRGPKGKTQPYFYPVGWQGFGLDVQRYGDNNNWLMNDGNHGEWYVMYHGTKFEGLKGIMKKTEVNGKVVDRQFQPGSRQIYANNKCILTGKEIGKGVYFSNHIEVCEHYYTSSTQIGDQQFIVAFQVRVKPEALRQAQKSSHISDRITQYKKNNQFYNKSLDDMTLWDNDYFVINNPQDIRPYRILLKNVTKNLNDQSKEKRSMLERQFPGCRQKLKLHNYFQRVGLSPDDFDPNYNKVWDKYQFGNYCDRGPKNISFPYFYPVGWKGYALKVKGKYDNGNDSWLMKNGNSEEWYVMYHGTSQQCLKGIMEMGLRAGLRQAYANQICLITNKTIDHGVYFMNHIEQCERYSFPSQIGNSKYLMAIQVRVRPSALRQCQKRSDSSMLISEYKKNNKSYDKSLDNMALWDNDYFVVNKTEDIRPYRILLKQIC